MYRNAESEPVFGRARAFRRNTVPSPRKPDACKTLAGAGRIRTLVPNSNQRCGLDDGDDCAPAEIRSSDRRAGQRVVEFVEASSLSELAASGGERVRQFIESMPTEAAREKPVRVRCTRTAPDATGTVKLGRRDEARLVECDRRYWEGRPELAWVGQVLDQASGDLAWQRLDEQWHQRDDRLDLDSPLSASRKAVEEAAPAVVAAIEQPCERRLRTRLCPGRELIILCPSGKPCERGESIGVDAVDEDVLPLERVDAEGELSAVVEDFVEALRKSRACTEPTR